MQHVVYLFDRFRLDVTRRKLLSAGGLVQPLNSRAMEALLTLVANAGQVVEKRRLMEAIWPDTIVEDNNLNQCILAIRKALGETAGSNQFVMTVQGRGFCFVCPVHKRMQESDSTSVARPPPARPSTRGLRNRLHVPVSFWLGLALGAAIVTIAMLPFALH